jgi:hypothetical protein
MEYPTSQSRVSPLYLGHLHATLTLISRQSGIDASSNPLRSTNESLRTDVWYATRNQGARRPRTRSQRAPR